MDRSNVISLAARREQLETSRLLIMLRSLPFEEALQLLQEYANSVENFTLEYGPSKEQRIKV